MKQIRKLSPKGGDEPFGQNFITQFGYILSLKAISQDWVLTFENREKRINVQFHSVISKQNRIKLYRTR